MRYSTSTSTAEPTTTGYDYTNECVDEALTNLVPWVAKNAASGTSLLEAVTLGQNADNLNRWYMNSTSMVVEWSNPSLMQVWENDTEFTDTSGVVRLDEADEWAVFVIDTQMPIPHPIHLHGHDVSGSPFCLGAGSRRFPALTKKDALLTIVVCFFLVQHPGPGNGHVRLIRGAEPVQSAASRRRHTACGGLSCDCVRHG